MALSDRARWAALAGRPPGVLAELALIAAVLVWLFAPSAERITAGWTKGINAEYAHGIPVALLALWLFLRLEPAAAGQWTARHSWSLLTLILALSLAWLVGGLVIVNTIQDLAFFALFVTALVLTLRPSSMLQAAAPVFVLSLTLPDWKLIYPNLQDIAVTLSVPLVNAFGTPAVADGYRIMVPAGNFSVDQACGGLGQLLAALAVATVFASIERLRPVIAVVFVAGAAVVAVFMNALRISIVVLLGGVLGMDSDLVQHHNWAGWTTFAIGISAYLVLFSQLLHRRPSLARSRDTVQGEISPAENASESDARWRYVVITIALAAVGPVLGYLPARGAGNPQQVAIKLPNELSGWSLVTDDRPKWRPEFQGADVSGLGHYREADGNDIYVYIAYYGQQSPGKEAVYFDNVPQDRKIWRAVGPTRLRAVSLSSRPESVEQTTIRSAGLGELVAWQWFYSGAVATGNRLEAKLLSLWPALHGDTSMGTVIVAADKGSATRDVESNLAGFVDAWTDHQSHVASAFIAVD
jgi:EpsI family protein